MDDLISNAKKCAISRRISMAAAPGHFRHSIAMDGLRGGGQSESLLKSQSRLRLHSEREHKGYRTPSSQIILTRRLRESRTSAVSVCWDL